MGGSSLLAELLGLEAKLSELRSWIIISVVGVVIAPVVFHKTITKTSMQNLVAIFSWLYVAGLMVTYASGLLPSPSKPCHWQVFPPADMSFIEFASVLPIFIFSFTCHQNL